MTIEDVLKIISVVLIPSIGSVVWLLSQVYGLRGDLRALQSESEQSSKHIQQIEATVDRLARSLSELSLHIARHGIDIPAKNKRSE